MSKIQEEVKRVKELIFGIPETQTIKECGDMDMGIDVEEKDHDGSYMAKQQLYNISKKAQSVHDRLGSGEELEDWMESKIAQMSDGIDSVTNSFDYTEHNDDEVVTIDLEEEIMSGLQGGYADDSEDDNSYNFKSKGALGSEPELEGEGFTDPESNYSKIRKGYNFDSDGPRDSYIDPSDDYNIGYELGEQDDGGGTGESDDGGGAGTASMGVWDSGITRGIANQVANSKWGDSYQPARGKGNTLW